MDDINRIFKAYPGHDCFQGCAFNKPDCAPGQGGFHGHAALRLYFAVAVPGRGAVSFDLHTSLYPQTAMTRSEKLSYRPLGVVDLHYATPPDYVAEYAPAPKECNLIGKCWTDYTYLAAEDGYDVLLKGGEEAVWSWLAERFLPDVVAGGSTSSSGEGRNDGR